MAAEPIAEGAAEEAYEDGHRAEYYPDLDLAALEVFHAVERKGRECRKTAAEASHRAEGEDRTVGLTPVAGSIPQPTGQHADQEASDTVDDPCRHAHHRLPHRYEYQIAADGSYAARTEYQ